MKYRKEVEGTQPIIISVSGNFTADLDFSDKFIITLTGNLTLDVKNIARGFKYTFIIKQDSTGSRVLTLSNNFVGNPTIISTANSITVLEFAGEGDKLHLQNSGSGSGEGTVTSVNSVGPNVNGNVVLTQDEIADGETYVQTHNDYTDTEKSNLSFTTPVQIAYTTAIPFDNICTDIATHTLADNDVLSINTTGAVDNGGAQLIFDNGSGLYTPVLTAFHVVGQYDSTYSYTMLTFIRKRGLYICSILNFD